LRGRTAAGREDELISVVIPTCERPGLLEQALGSLAQQSYRDFEVIVVNDGGPSIAPAMAAWQRRFPLTLIELAERAGPARSRNAAIERASGEYLAFLDDDDIFLPEHLETAYRSMTDNALDLVYLRALVSNRRVDRVPTVEPGAYFKAYPFDERFLYIANYIHTGSVVVTNFADTGARFDESLPLCEDWDMWLSLRAGLGFTFGFVDKLTSVYHQVPDTPGAVSRGQLTSPSPFSLVRQRIHRKWPNDDPQVIAYRQWLTDFEDYRDRRIGAGQLSPVNLFDRVLSYLYESISRDMAPDPAGIPAVFAQGSGR
jgi:glycosyltransferase involved in cell wall biosynthesis